MTKVLEGLGGPIKARALVEKAVCLGVQERGAPRLIAVRVPETVVNERRCKARSNAKKRMKRGADLDL